MWASDQDLWMPYSAQVCRRLEAAYKSGIDEAKAEVEVDSERFVDMRNPEKMKQKRKDAPHRYRAVRRVVAPSEFQWMYQDAGLIKKFGLEGFFRKAAQLNPLRWGSGSPSEVRSQLRAAKKEGPVLICDKTGPSLVFNAAIFHESPSAAATWVGQFCEAPW